VNAKKAFNPSPGACANGRLAYSAMISVATAAAMIVTTASIWITCPWEYPCGVIAFERMPGLTTTM